MRHPMSTNDAPAQASVEADRDILRRAADIVERLPWHNAETIAHRMREASPPSTVGVEDEAVVARWRRDSELLSAIQDECWDVRFTSTPNADAGDYTVNIEIVGHFMAAPQERVVGENYNEDLRAALEQAMTAEPYPPARPVYDDPAIRSSIASEGA